MKVTSTTKIGAQVIESSQAVIADKDGNVTPSLVNNAFMQTFNQQVNMAANAGLTIDEITVRVEK